MPAPDQYPLPWCTTLDQPYWRVNFALCLTSASWRAWQRGRPMSEIIPVIDALVAEGKWVPGKPTTAHV